MCCVLFDYRSHSDGLVVVANRDEFYARPTAPASWWQDYPQILGGRDLEQGGTWLGVNRTGGLALVTNYRDPKREKAQALSRGHLVRDFLIGSHSPAEFLSELRNRAPLYNDFNLICGHVNELFWFSSVTLKAVRLEPGVYGLSNHLLDTPWPKVVRGKRGFSAILRAIPKGEDALFELMRDSFPAPDEELPDTGVGLTWERILSPLFVESPGYGTRSTTLVRLTDSGHTAFTERTYRSRDRWEARDCSFSSSSHE